MLKEVKKFGQRGGHIILPGSLIGKVVEVNVDNLISQNKQQITWKEIDKKIEDAIYKAKHGY